MINQPKEVFALFRKSMLSKSDDWINMLADNVSLVGPLAQVQGKDKFVEINKPFFNAIKGSELLKAVNIDDYIITQITTDVDTPTGKVVRLKVCEWYEIKDNMIVSLKVYFDTTELLNEMKSD